LISVIIKYKTVEKEAIVAVNQPQMVNKSLLKIKEEIKQLDENIKLNM
jgi:hypothetical protein